MLLLRSRPIPIKEWSSRIKLKAERENHLSAPSVSELCGQSEIQLSTFSFARPAPAWFCFPAFLISRNPDLIS